MRAPTGSEKPVTLRWLGRTPDQCGHAAALALVQMPVPPMREKTLAVREGAPLAAADGFDSEPRQAAPRQSDEVRLPTAPFIRHEIRRGSGILADENFAHVFADLEVALRNGGTQPGRDPGGRDPHRS